MLGSESSLCLLVTESGLLSFILSSFSFWSRFCSRLLLRFGGCSMSGVYRASFEVWDFLFRPKSLDLIQVLMQSNIAFLGLSWVVEL